MAYVSSFDRVTQTDQKTAVWLGAKQAIDPGRDWRFLRKSSSGRCRQGSFSKDLFPGRRSRTGQCDGKRDQVRLAMAATWPRHHCSGSFPQSYHLGKSLRIALECQDDLRPQFEVHVSFVRKFLEAHLLSQDQERERRHWNRNEDGRLSLDLGQALHHAVCGQLLSAIIDSDQQHGRHEPGRHQPIFSSSS
jgi:hypothetical protein